MLPEVDVPIIIVTIVVRSEIKSDVSVILFLSVLPLIKESFLIKNGLYFPNCVSFWNLFPKSFEIFAKCKGKCSFQNPK